MAQQAQKLRRSRDNRFLFGVAGGLAEYFDVDPVLVRTGWVLLTMATVGVAALLYIVLASIIPSSPQSDSEEVTSMNDGSSARSENAIKIGFSAIRTVLGIMLVVIGMITLLRELEVIGAIRWDVVWPAFIVLTGITILLPSLIGLSRRTKVETADTDPDHNAQDAIEVNLNQEPSKRHVVRNSFGVGMIVVGMMILLRELNVIGSIRWDIFWPLIIVVIGPRHPTASNHCVQALSGHAFSSIRRQTPRQHPLRSAARRARRAALANHH